MAAVLTPTSEHETVFVSFPISKFEKDKDGDLIVYGKATDGSVDSDEQIVDTGWSREAMRKWFETGANVRMSHDPRKPVGKGLQIELSDDGHFVKSLVVDRDAKRLVEKGVLTAYSVGISRPVIDRDTTGKARGGIIKGGEFAEISLVDRPANRNCGFQLVKADSAGAARWTGKMFGDTVSLLAPTPADVARAVSRRAAEGGPRVYSDPIAQRLADALAADVSDPLLKDGAMGGQVTAHLEDAHSATYEALRDQMMDHGDDDDDDDKKKSAGMGDADLDALGKAEAAVLGKKARVFTAEQRREHAGAGNALPDGSYPIPDKDALRRAAILARSKHGNWKAASRLIARRARELGVPNPMKPAGATKVAGPPAAAVKAAARQDGDAEPDADDKPAKPGKKNAPKPGKKGGKKAGKKGGKKGKPPFGGAQAPPFGAGKAAKPAAIRAKIARLEAELAKCQPTDGVRHAPPAKDLPPARGGGSVMSTGGSVVADEPEWMRLGKAMDRITDAPYAAQRAHDATCAAYHPDAVKAAYPALAHAGEAVDPGELKEMALSAVASGNLDEGERWLSAAKAAEFLAAADPLAVTDAHAGLHKSFTDMYPSVRLSPGQVMPQRFRRPYVSEGHARTPAPSGDTSPGTVPSYRPEAADYRRGPITAGHEAPSPGNKGDSNPYPAGTPAGAVYAHAVMAQQASAAMRTIHDTYAARWNGVCPMSLNAGPAGTDRRATTKAKKKKGKKGLKPQAVPGAMDPVPAMPATPSSMKAAGAVPGESPVVTGMDITAMLARIERKLKGRGKRDEQHQTLIKSQAREMKKLRRDIDILGSQPSGDGPNRSAITKAATVLEAERRSLVDEAGTQLRAEKLAFFQSLAQSGNPADRELANAQIHKMLEG